MGSYLVAAALFILSLKWLSHPRTARHGVLAGEIGMALAVVGTLIQFHVGLAVGADRNRARFVDRRSDGHLDADDRRAAADGAVARVRCARGRTRWHRALLRSARMARSTTSRWRILAIEVFLGSLTFTGSLVAFGKLQELIPSSIKGLPQSELDQLSLLGAAAICAHLADV